MLDINLFREDKGHNPEIIRESQRRRYANVELVDEVIHLDKEWRQRNPLHLDLLSFLLICFWVSGFLFVSLENQVISQKS